MHIIEVLEHCRQLAHHSRGIAEVHAAEVVTPKRIDESCQVMPLLCGLHTGVLMGLNPRARAIRRVRVAM